MRGFRTAVLAGIAGLAVAGTAFAAASDTHILKVAMPDGSVARIAYRGDIPPRVVVAPAQVMMPVSWFAAPGPSPFAPFASFDRVMAEMDRQAATMMRQVAAMQAAPAMADGGTGVATLASVPAETVRYSMVSTSSGSGMCSRSVRITAMGAGEKPKVVSTSSGDCGTGAVPAAGNAVPALTTVDLKQAQPKPLTAKTTI
jgi:hypothetical protein